MEGAVEGAGKKEATLLREGTVLITESTGLGCWRSCRQ